MPHSCCSSRCFNSSLKGYALMRFPNEIKYRKAWSDAVFDENVSNHSLENFRLRSEYYAIIVRMLCRIQIKIVKKCYSNSRCTLSQQIYWWLVAGKN